MKLSSDKEYLVLKNQKLVHYLVRKLGITQKSSDYEDIVSIGTIGLVRAAITFDSSKNIAFSTYASKCINNEIFRYLNKSKKYEKNISLDEPIANDGKGNELTLANTLKDSKSSFINSIESEEYFIHFTNLVLNYLDGIRRLAVLYRMGNLSQKIIAELLNLSQSYVSRILSKTIREIRRIADQPIHYKEVFSIAIIGDTYSFSFSSKDINNFNKIFASMLQKSTFAKTLSDFKVIDNKERIVIQLPTNPESFSFIASIIREIDDYSLTFISEKNVLPSDSSTLL